ncbi:hypothetical protein CNBH1830 [Cryptococcus deneoformans B-3501A]|uniref:MYND-type domain-containing protein n=1 Tax=Cryptococcus deneoformans (strain JEC21 / ATCC MYA-565) TaxID=214684 RepID=Q5KBN6_CRYD1|nr:hypothetical protein CNI01950 [Cryptococcus neoformans var. neoformans JEC21]XP_773728.1 hypothetical protein CNBH1830 [Cryptococcus neoformans var. neoformans B-3501A]AAW45686.2 hypothetical protein CNI01950 [Cryptococcus neoformans var. neoformans JEC21]EAL19081.1 hypothetical protein CNBH1830 [Cryptococcus neoformans var. neoformans B-3501A]
MVNILEQKVDEVRLEGKLREGEDSAGESETEDIPAPDGEPSIKNKKKKKKKKGKSKASSGANPLLGSIPDEEPAPPPETPEEKAKWDKELKKGCRTFSLPSWYVLDDRTRPILNTFLTPSCKKFALQTPRLRLRQVEVGDTTGIRRIKMEPTVQRTQLYGSPSISDIKESFQNRYIRSSIPRASTSTDTKYREEYVFAITALDPSSLAIKPAGNVRITNRLTSAEGYIGNIALSLLFTDSCPSLLPQKGQVYTQPTFEQFKKMGLVGKMFYEVHPQLWGQGIMSEAFVEVLRFAMEEVGCTLVQSDPTVNNDASIRLCTKNGMHFVEKRDNEWDKPQLIHEISSKTWWEKNRPGKVVMDRWGGKEVCRWCLNFRLATPTIQCQHCDWAKYCSRECQRADWVRTNGHQSECDLKP